MSVIFGKTIVNIKNNTLVKVLPIPVPILLLKRIANTNTNNFVTILFTVYYIQQLSCFFPRSSTGTDNVNRMIVVEKMAKSL